METVDNHHGLGGTGHVFGGEDLGGETLPAFVGGGHAEMVEGVGLDAHRAGGAFHYRAVVEVEVADGGIDDILAWVGGGLLWVFHGVPTEFQLVLGAKLNPKIAGGERLHHVFGVVHLVDVAEQGLVDGAGERETEVGVEAVAHVAEILVGEGFEDGGRDGGLAGFVVVAVIHHAALPVAVF